VAGIAPLVWWDGETGGGGAVISVPRSIKYPVVRDRVLWMRN